MSPELLAWLLGTTSTLLLSLVGAILVGALVPGSRLDKAEAVLAAKQETVDTQRYTISEQKDHIMVLQSSGGAAVKLLDTMREIVQHPQTGGTA